MARRGRRMAWSRTFACAQRESSSRLLSCGIVVWDRFETVFVPRRVALPLRPTREGRGRGRRGSDAQGNAPVPLLSPPPLPPFLNSFTLSPPLHRGASRAHRIVIKLTPERGGNGEAVGGRDGQKYEKQNGKLLLHQKMVSWRDCVTFTYYIILETLIYILYIFIFN